MITHRFFAIAIAAALSITTFSTTASAAEATAATKLVNYADLNLGTSEGRATLDRRIKHAVQDVCQPVLDDAADAAKGRGDYNRCLSETASRVHTQIAALPTYQRLASH